MSNPDDWVVGKPDDRRYIAFYAGTQAELDAAMVKVDAYCRARSLHIVNRSWGNGHWTLTLASAPTPRVCSGTRGRGRKQARARRRELVRLLAFGKLLRDMPFWAEGVSDTIKMQHRRWRRRRGPKGHRVLVP